METPPFQGSSSMSLNSPLSREGLEGNSLGAIANRIQNLEQLGLNLDFRMVITLIQFIVKLDILQNVRRKDFTALMAEEIQSGGELHGCSLRQGKRWRTWGTRLAEFAGAST
jgi:hypothetical protein